MNTFIQTLKNPVIRVCAIAFIMLAVALIALPGKAFAATPTTSTQGTTQNVPWTDLGYYYDAFGNIQGGYVGGGVRYNCVNTNCAPTYTACSNPSCQYYGSQVPYRNYVPYAQTTTAPNNPTNGYGYSTVSTPYVSYPMPTYVPYVKSGNTLSQGTPRTVPYYAFNTDGTLANGSGSAYPTYAANTQYGATNGGYPTNGYANANNRGFVMTGGSY